jgi:hypothetical protein
MPTSTKNEKKQLKQNQKAHEAQAKADKLMRHALDNGKTEKAEKAQDKFDREAEKAMSTRGDEVATTDDTKALLAI